MSLIWPVFFFFWPSRPYRLTSWIVLYRIHLTKNIGQKKKYEPSKFVYLKRKPKYALWIAQKLHNNKLNQLDFAGTFQSFQERCLWGFIYTTVFLFRHEHFWHICERETQMDKTSIMGNRLSLFWISKHFSNACNLVFITT